MTEDKLNRTLVEYFKEKDKNVFAEIPFLSRRIDIVVLNGEEIYSYELKLKNWKKAIEQLKDQRIVSNYSILCMPKKNMTIQQEQKITKELSFYGFGFNLWDQFNSELIEVLKPRYNKLLNPYYNNKLKSNIKDTN